MRKLTHCPKHHKRFEEEWAPSTGTILFCPACGGREEDFRSGREPGLTSKTEVAAVNQVPISTGSVRSQILADPVMGFAKKLAEKIISEYGYDAKVVFRNRQGSCAYKDAVIFGYASLRCSFEDGFSEYKTWRYLWRGMNTQGMCGVWAEVLHEVAHIEQLQTEGNIWGSAHTPCWIQAVQELQVLYPFEEAARSL